jgi:hypothetical protein
MFMRWSAHECFEYCRATGASLFTRLVWSLQMPSTPKPTTLSAITLIFSALALIGGCNTSSDGDSQKNANASGAGGEASDGDPGRPGDGDAGSGAAPTGEGNAGAPVDNGDAGGSTGDTPVVPSGLPEDILQACRTAVVCQFGDIGITLDNCVADLVSERLQPSFTLPERRQQIDRALDCASSAVDCDAYVSCATLDVPPCSSSAAGCQDDLAFTCVYAGYKPHVTDCAALGMACETGHCVVPADASDCDFNTFIGRCEGTSVVTCYSRAGGGGGERLQPCAEGSECVEVASVGAGCLPLDAEPCEPFTAECEGNSVSRCVGGYRVTDDCAAVGLTCGKQSAEYAPACLASPMECTPHLPAELTGDACDGDDLVGCANGANVVLHCSDFGRGPCMMTSATTGTCG